MNNEYWIIDGQAVGADGNVGDYNHAGVVLENILYELHDLWPRIEPEGGILECQRLTQYIDDDILTTYKSPVDQIAQQIKRDNPEYRDDERLWKLVEYAWNASPLLVDYALQYMGWIRVRGNYIETQTISESILEDIAHALFDVDDYENTYFTIEVMGSQYNYYDVPLFKLENLKMETMAEFRGIRNGLI